MSILGNKQRQAGPDRSRKKNHFMSLFKKLCRNLSLLACCFDDDFSVFIMAYSTVN